MRIVDEPAATLRDELAGDDDHIADTHGYGWREIDIVNDLQVHSVLGHDRELLVHRVGAVTAKIVRRILDRTGDHDIRDALLRNGGTYVGVGIPREDPVGLNSVHRDRSFTARMEDV